MQLASYRCSSGKGHKTFKKLLTDSVAGGEQLQAVNKTIMSIVMETKRQLAATGELDLEQTLKNTRLTATCTDVCAL